jgi:GDP-L-fucose synthase
MNILITGGRGFIATHLTDYLKDQHTIYSPSRSELDCLDKSSVDRFFDQHTIDAVIHTALTGRENLFSIDTQYLVDSLSMWRNLYDNRHRFKQLIQFGSAYELDLSIPNASVSLADVCNTLPKYSYGYAKNIMARICADTENFYTLRLFGNFHYTEKDFRFFKKLYTSDNFVINEDKYFDYFYLRDVLKVVEFVINEKPKDRDINLVYKEKYLLSNQVAMFSEINQLTTSVEVKATGVPLTGDHSILYSFGIELDGLAAGFAEYGKLS